MLTEDEKKCVAQQMFPVLWPLLGRRVWRVGAVRRWAWEGLTKQEMKQRLRHSKEGNKPLKHYLRG